MKELHGEQDGAGTQGYPDKTLVLTITTISKFVAT